MNELIKSQKIRLVACVLLAIFSILVLSRLATSPGTYHRTITSLDKKKEVVMEMSGESAIVSSLISAIPDDTMTPIANELAKLSKYFLLILGVIYLEKYSLTLLGGLIFGVLLPLRLILTGINLFKSVVKTLNIIKRLMIMCLAIMITIPIGEIASGVIYKTYESSIEEVMNTASEEIKDSTEEKSGITKIISRITDGVTNTADTLKHKLRDFVEAIAVLIIIDCVIPMIVFIASFWTVKNMTGLFADVQSVDIFKAMKHFASHKNNK